MAENPIVSVKSGSSLFTNILLVLILLSIQPWGI